MTKPQKKRSGVERTGKRSAAAELLLEIGTEELPYQFVQPALHRLAESAESLFKEHRLVHGSVRTLGTPRRLVLVVDALASRQAAATKEAMGPSKTVAFDAGGQPTKAAIGFAASQGVAVSDLEIRRTPKGDYVIAVKRETGQPTATILANMLPSLILGLSFPKSMRWDPTGIKFARPIRWLVALYGGKTIEVEFGTIQAGNRTWGHRFLGATDAKISQGFPVKDFKSYQKELERHGVIPDQKRRRAMILKQLATLSESAGGKRHRDEELLEQAIFTVEYPHAILGSFDPQYRALPKEILMTAMKEHQGYFSLMRPDGTLLPRFILVTNIKLSNMRLIREGNERVLAARLADAKFFFDEDRKTKLADRVEKLKHITFHQKLGTLHQKQNRVAKLIERFPTILTNLDDNKLRDLHSTCKRAAQLYKADLTSGIVGEFPSLQGIMGGEYARHDGEPEAVSHAISEQYLPRSIEGELPSTFAGKILSLTDRLDTIAAFFHVGIVPTGSEDPFALRRHAMAIARIILEGDLHVDLGQAIDHAREIVAGEGFKGIAIQESEARRRFAEFIYERIRYYCRSVHGVREDVANAVLRATSTDRFVLIDVLSKIKTLQAITGRPEFDPLMIGFKRAHHLVEKEQWDHKEVATALFQHPTETGLYKALNEAKHSVPALIKRGDYGNALDALVRMKPAIDGFFASVMVNTDDQALRTNRLSLLYEVDQLFLAFADFSQIAVQGA